MGIFDFFRKIAKENRAEKIVKEKVSFSRIEDWIEEKMMENELKEKEIFAIIKEKIKKFTKELREKIVILEDVDIETKKEKDEIKEIVNNSRKKYIESVEHLIERLNNLEEAKLKIFIEKINKIFFDFNKSSYKNYERATILIGKEMRSIKESLKVFSKELVKTFDESKEIMDSFKNLLAIKEKLDMTPLIDRTLGKTSEAILSFNEKIMVKEEENKRLLEKIEKIKKSPNYLGRLRTQKKIESLKEELRNDIFSLRQLLDFKALTNFYHSFEKEMNLLKDHREDFQTNFQKDSGKIIIDLLNEAKLNNNTILEKVKQIRAKTEEISDYEKEIGGDETSELYLKIEEVISKIDNLKIKKAKEEKRHEKLRANKEDVINSLKQELDKMNVEVI